MTDETPAAPKKRTHNSRKGPLRLINDQTAGEKKILNTGDLIFTSPPTSQEMAFTHSVLCQVGLPRSKTDAREFERRSGDAWVIVQAGYLDEGRGPVQQSLPYGPMPRLALAWISTYAVKHRTTEIPIGNSAREFLRLMGMDSQGHRYTTLRQQMHALAACRLQLGFKGKTFNGQPIEEFEAWINNNDDNQMALWPGVMTLSDRYGKTLQESAVPLDNRALHALKGSALGLDIYAWLAHRLHRIEGRPFTLYWKPIREQFGQEYTGPEADKNFKKSFLPQLRKVLEVYPHAKVKPVTGGLLLSPSPPPIPYKSS